MKISTLLIHIFLFIGGIFYLAYTEALKGNSKFKMAAVLVRGGQIISIGHNYLCSDPKGYTLKNYLRQGIHAEIDAILSARGNIEGAKLLVYRFRRLNQHLAESKPCIQCQEYIKKTGISYTFYWDSNNIYKERFKYS